MSARGWLQAGLAFLAVTQGLAGSTQLLLSKLFYDRFPWVSTLPPYSQHLMRDGGALTLAYVLVVAAVRMDPLLVRVALAANLVFTVPHSVRDAHRSSCGARSPQVQLAR